MDISPLPPLHKSVAPMHKYLRLQDLSDEKTYFFDMPLRTSHQFPFLNPFV